jgi:hypothetical protein
VEPSGEGAYKGPAIVAGFRAWEAERRASLRYSCLLPQFGSEAQKRYLPRAGRRNTQFKRVHF